MSGVRTLIDQSDDAVSEIVLPDGAVTDRPPSALRAMLRKGGPDIKTIGAERAFFGDAYFNLLHESWGSLLLQFLLGFLLFNLCFATLYAFDPSGLAIEGNEADVPRFWRDFFFSVHTLATIGYGNVYPVTMYANIVVVLEAMTGVLGFALTTGLAFARFARPTARVMFSDVTVVQPFEEVPTIMLRAVNQRHNLILEASARASLLREVVEADGTRMRRFFDLELVRNSNPMFALSWTIMHKITESSPLYGMTPEVVAASGDELIIVISGTDEAMAQTIYARTAYEAADIRWNMRFADILSLHPSGTRVLDYRKFHEVEPLRQG